MPDADTVNRALDFFEIGPVFLKINLYRKKKFYRQGAKKEPFYLPLDMPLIYEVIDWIEDIREGERPFNFCGVTAWLYVSEVFEGYYPHFFSFDYITKGVDNAKDINSLISILIHETGLDLATVTGYIMQNPKHWASLNLRELELLKKQGVVKT